MKRVSGFPLFITLCFMVLFVQFPLSTSAKSSEEMEASTVLVTCGDLNGAFGMGSGFVIGNSDHVVTNHHVIDCAEQGGPVNIVLEPGKVIPAQVIWSSQVKDLAVLQTQSQLGRPSVSFTKAKDVKTTDHVFVMGFPGAAAENFIDSSSFTTVKVSQGIISAKVKSTDGVALYQTDAPINPGNSGGPLFTDSGAVIGINSMASLVRGVVLDDNGNTKNERIRLGDNIGWSIQVDELLVELDKLGIKYQVEGRHVNTNTGGGSEGPSIITFIALGLGGLAVLLAFLAFILSLTKKGRVIVKEVSRRVIPNSIQSKNQSTPNIKAVVPPQVPDGPKVQNVMVKPYLVGVSGPCGGQKFQIGQPITIGRNPVGSQIVIQSNTVSSMHCTVSFDPMYKVFFVTDLSSTNGTFTSGGQRLQPNIKMTLNSGQRFYLGNPEITFEVRLEN